MGSTRRIDKLRRVQVFYIVILPAPPLPRPAVFAAKRRGGRNDTQEKIYETASSLWGTAKL